MAQSEQNQNHKASREAAGGDFDFSEEAKAKRQELADEGIRADKEALEHDWTGTKHKYRELMNQWGREEAGTTRTGLDLARGVRHWFALWKEKGRLPEDEMKTVGEEVGGLWRRAFGRGDAVSKLEAAQAIRDIYLKQPEQFLQFLRSVLPLMDRPQATLIDELNSIIASNTNLADKFRDDTDWDKLYGKAA